MCERGDRVAVEVKVGGAILDFDATAESSGRAGDSILIKTPATADHSRQNSRQRARSGWKNKMTRLILFLIPISVFAQLGASPGSLFSASGRLADSARDVRASEVNDIVTIVVNESQRQPSSAAPRTPPANPHGRRLHLPGLTRHHDAQADQPCSAQLTIRSWLLTRDRRRANLSLSTTISRARGRSPHSTGIW